MKKNIKIFIISLIVFSLLSMVIFTGISYSYEPHGWVQSKGAYGNAQKYYANCNGFGTFFNKYNFTESQGDFSIFLCAAVNGNSTGTQPLSYYGFSINPFTFSVSILNENLSFPYNSMALEIGKITLSSSGPILMNVSAYNDSNILTALSSSNVYGTPNNPLGYSDQNSVPGPICSYGGMYSIFTYYNYTTATQHYMKAGNYSMNFTLHFTPVFEIGPYYVTGNQLNISIAWRWTILPTPPYT